MTATVAEVAAPPEPAVAGPDEVLLIPWSGEVESKARRLASQSQVPLADVIASWLAAAPEGSPVPAEIAGACNVLLPGLIVAQVRAEARRRSLTLGEVAAARLASIAGRS